MRFVSVSFALVCFASSGCGSTPGSSTPGPQTNEPAPLTLVSPELQLAPGQEKTFCYYTTLTNATPVGVRKFESTMTPGSHHLILFTTSERAKPDGTLEECGFPGGRRGPGGTRSIPVWAYAAQTPTAEIAMPSGVGMTFKERQPVILQMHYLNARPESLRPSATLTIRLHARDDYVRAAPFVTFDTNIRVPAGAMGASRGTCVVPEGAKFFLASTHSHKFTTRARVLDGDEVVVDTDDWEHPKMTQWTAEPFRTFRTGHLTYECTYNNTSPSTLTTGDSAQTDEMCMAIGYFFPATGMRFCVDEFVLPF